MKPVRVGFVGLGGICRHRHIPGLRRIEGVEIVAVANRSRGSSEAAARKYEIPVVCDSWQELVRRDDLDAVFIGTWPYMHHPVTLAALDAGKHVFCQARMAMNYDEAKEMYDRAVKSGRVAMLCPVPFGLSVDRTIARLLRQGDLGELRLVIVRSFSPAFADPDTVISWRKDHCYSGLNMHTLGMYIEVIHRWFGWTGSVSAQTHTFVQERPGPDGERVGVEIPDQILFNTTMKAGFPVQYAISTTVHHGADAIEIYGTKGTLHYDVNADNLFGARVGESMGRVVVAPEDSYDVEHWRVERDFIDAVREGKEYRPNFEDGLRYMQVIQAVYDSANRGRTVMLE